MAEPVDGGFDDGPKLGLSFSYDGFGNRLSQSINEGYCHALELQYDMTSNYITNQGYSYDANGNLASTPAPGGHGGSK